MFFVSTWSKMVVGVLQTFIISLFTIHFVMMHTLRELNGVQALLKGIGFEDLKHSNLGCRCALEILRLY